MSNDPDAGRRAEQRPQDPASFTRYVIVPTLAVMEQKNRIPLSVAAVRMLVAIGWQESRFLWPVQVGSNGMVGPARGYWQFERGGGVAGVLRHDASKVAAEWWCANREVAPEPEPVWRALEHDDMLACAFARLLLWTDPRRLPEVEGAGWDCYVRNWRPGKPHPHTWAEAWALGEAQARMVPA
ncbi:hypothetical protein J4558_00080 [Leptolyngbya sp. 15MV]|nr:hypothetical protein J4558_00080 [Leptolyngbya sp. 15MV]